MTLATAGAIPPASDTSGQRRVAPDMLRYLDASQCYEDSDGDLLLVQNLLGHRLSTSTQIYAAFSRPKAARVVTGLFSRSEPPDEGEAA